MAVEKSVKTKTKVDAGVGPERPAKSTLKPAAEGPVGVKSGPL